MVWIGYVLGCSELRGLLLKKVFGRSMFGVLGFAAPEKVWGCMF